MFIRFVATVFCTCFFHAVGIAQKESTWWYFGLAAGIEFTNINPVADTNANDSASSYFLNGIGYGSTTMGSISDPITGELLFYGSMVGVFNANHQSMPNGLPHATALNSTGNGVGNSAEEGTLIIPRPNHPKQYYLIYLRTADLLYQDGIIAGAFATLVDMELDNGMGDVVTSYKNVLITDSTEEKLSATPHANGVDYWLMLRQGGTNNYHAFLITEDGISETPVISSLGMSSSTYNTQQGNLRFNHRGDILVHTRGDNLEIFDFDNANGTLSNLRSIISLGGSGLEFSPDDSKLYMGGPIQYDMSIPTQPAIQASELMLFNLGDPPLAGLQLGLDGKIYGNNFDGNQSYYMGCIHNPNAPGFAANYEDSVIYLQGKEGLVSVPQFLPNFFKTNFYADTVCVGEEANFYINFTFIDSVFWYFGDPGSGSANTDTAIAPSHIYDTAGSYSVTLIAKNGVRTDTVIKTIEVLAPPAFNLGPDREFCAATDSVKLGIGGQKGNYLWSTGSTDSTLWVTETGTYSLTFSNGCGADTDTIVLVGSLPLQVSLPADTALCDDQYVVLPDITNGSPYVKYSWSMGATTAATVVERYTTGLHTVFISLKATNLCGKDSASMEVTFYAQPDGALPADSIYCLDKPFYLLNPQSKGVYYIWPDGSGGSQYRVDSTGTYWLRSASECDTLTDTFRVVFNGEPKVVLGNDIFLCPGETLVLHNIASEIPGGQAYLWNTGSTDSVFSATLDTAVLTPTGFVMYTLRASYKACSTTDSIRIYRKGSCPERCKPHIPNVLTPNGDGINDALYIRMECHTKDLQLFIYNRWGQLVHGAEGQVAMWDGRLNGEPVSEGTYYLIIQYSNEQGEMQVYRNSISLLR